MRDSSELVIINKKSTLRSSEPSVENIHNLYFNLFIENMVSPKI